MKRREEQHPSRKTGATWDVMVQSGKNCRSGARLNLVNKYGIDGNSWSWNGQLAKPNFERNSARMWERVDFSCNASQWSPEEHQERDFERSEATGSSRGRAAK